MARTADRFQNTRASGSPDRLAVPEFGEQNLRKNEPKSPSTRYT